MSDDAKTLLFWVAGYNTNTCESDDYLYCKFCALSYARILLSN